MQTHIRLLLGSIGILALVGCSGYDNNYGSAPGYLVNGIGVADVDANGKLDILGMVSTDSGGTPTQGYVSTRFQNPDGSFALPPTRFGVGIGPANFVVADVNGDGRPDLVVANAGEHTVTVRLADPARPGFFLPALVLSTPGRIPLDVAVGDLNGDGLTDIVVAASFDPGATMIPTPVPSVMVFHQIPPPAPNAVQFASPAAYTIGGEPQAVTVADLDGNGFVDIAVATTANTVSVLLQTSAGVIASAVDYTTGVQPVAIKAADLDGDGKLDLLTANFGAAINPGTQGLSVLMQGSTAGTFLAPAHYVTGYRSTALAVGDLNGDGKLDVAVACEGLPGDPGVVSVFLQTPPAAATPGVLLPAVNYRGVWGPMGVAIADIDGDGHPDLVLADGDIVVRLNSAVSPGTFGSPLFFYN